MDEAVVTDMSSCIPSNFDIREDAGDGDSLSGHGIEQINGKNTISSSLYYISVLSSVINYLLTSLTRNV